jgi:hypothetical protein
VTAGNAGAPAPHPVAMSAVEQSTPTTNARERMTLRTDSA